MSVTKKRKRAAKKSGDSFFIVPPERIKRLVEEIAHFDHANAIALAELLLSIKRSVETCEPSEVFKVVDTIDLAVMAIYLESAEHFHFMGDWINQINKRISA